MNWKIVGLKELAEFVSKELKSRGIETVLVGGACVTIYSQNRYQSYDLDFATYEDMGRVTKAMKEIGFIVHGRHFEHPDCQWFVEFVSPPIAVGDQPIEKFKKIGSIQLLRPEDSVKDRLAAFFHWNDRQGLEQAIEICRARKVDLVEVEKWARKEKQLRKYQEFKEKLTS